MSNMRRRRPLSLGLDRFSGLYLWAIIIVMFSIWEPSLFPTTSTAHQIASGQAINGLVAIAVLIPLAADTYDLSVGSVTNLTAILVTVLQTQLHWGMWNAIALTVVVAAAIGALNGFFVVVLGINSFIATLGMATVVAAVQTIVSANNQPVPVITAAFVNLGTRSVGGFQIIFWYVIIAGLLCWWLMSFTPMGRYLYAIGGNREAARLSGIHVGRWTWSSLVLSSTICGITGVLYAGIYGPSLSFGPSLLLPAYAAVFLGSTQLTPGRYNIWGTLLAVYVLATGVQGLQFVTSVQWLSNMFNGVAVIGAVGFAVWRQKARVRAEAAVSPDAPSLFSSAGSGLGGDGQPKPSPAVREAPVDQVLSAGDNAASRKGSNPLARTLRCSACPLHRDARRE